MPANVGRTDAQARRDSRFADTGSTSADLMAILSSGTDFLRAPDLQGLRSPQSVERKSSLAQERRTDHVQTERKSSLLQEKRTDHALTEESQIGEQFAAERPEDAQPREPKSTAVVGSENAQERDSHGSGSR